MERNLASYTALGPNPAYISINETEAGAVEFTVRSSDGVEVSILLDRADPLAEMFLLPFKNIAQSYVDSVLGDLSLPMKRKMIEALSPTLKRQLFQEVENLL